MRNIQQAFFMFLAVFAINVAYAEPEVNPIPVVSDEWRFSISPYAWGSGLSSNLFMNNSAIGKADLSSGKVLSNLNGVAMLTAEAHKGNWGLMGDLVYAQMNKQSARVVDQADLGSTANLKNTIFTGALTYTMAKSPNLYLDGLAGLRSINTTATVNVHVIGYPLSTNLSKSTTTVDPIIGLKGRYRIADSSWYIPFYGDVGGGGGVTNVTWQAMTGVAKAFTWGDVTLAYRALYYDMKAGGLLQKTTMSGPVLGVTFNF